MVFIIRDEIRCREDEKLIKLFTKRGRIMNCYIKMLQKSIKRVESEFDFSAIIDHNSSKGMFREHIIKSFLRPFLPGCYGISGGQAFNNNGDCSKQLDIVIYDALYSYIAPYTEDFIYFPCESVYGNIEIKSHLDKNSLKSAISNIESLKKMKRAPISTYYVNPIKPLITSGINWNIEVTSEYFGVIFAYTSISAMEILKHIEKGVVNNEMRKEYLPNIIVLFEKQQIITRFHTCEDGMTEIKPLKNYDGFLVMDCKENILSEFLIMLLIILRSIELQAMDIQELSKDIHQQIFQDKFKEIEHIWLKT